MSLNDTINALPNPFIFKVYSCCFKSGSSNLPALQTVNGLTRLFEVDDH